MNMKTNEQLQRKGRSGKSNDGSAKTSRQVPANAGGALAGTPVFLQAKLTVGPVSDPLEQEADKVATKVMRSPEQRELPCQGECEQEQLQRQPDQEEEEELQRQPEEEEEEEELQRQPEEEEEELQRQPEEEEEEELLQTAAEHSGSGHQAAAAPRNFESRLKSMHGCGEALPSRTRGFMESRMGSDFGHVRVHQGAQAHALNREISARAFTLGSDIFFGAGQYQPESEKGRHLLAHELTHVLQQGGARSNAGGASFAVQPVAQRIQRASLQDELNKELESWAKDAGKTTDPKHKDYAFDLQEYAWSLIGDPSGTGPLPEPKAAKARKAWEKKFRKATLLAQMILAAGPKVVQKEDRAAMILNYLAQAGFTAEAVTQSASMTDVGQIQYIYAGVLQRLDKAGASELTTITRFFIAKKGQKDNPILDKLTSGSGDFTRKLNNAQLTAILKPLITAYEKEPFLIDLLSEILLRKQTYRKVFSDWMWKEGKGAFLFKLLQSKYFIEPEYGPTVLADVGELKMEQDMRWVYANKQKYYVDYLVQLGVDSGVKIDAPKNLKFNTIKAWLDANTENIGSALAKKYPEAPDQWIKVYQEIADIFFYHVSGRNVQPDPGGKLAKLKAAAPAKMRLMADCDVFSTYAMRFFNSVRDPANPAFKAFQPVGYMALDPKGGEGHSVALMRRKGDYYVINNKEVTAVGVHEAKPDEKKEQAIKAMKRDALQVYDAEPASYKVYYADAGADGAMPRALMKIDESTRRADLEP